jgi:hypothetical protein
MRLLFCALALCAMVSGCAKSKMSTTARTATEQLLLSNAVDQSLTRVEFSSFAGSKVFFDDKYLDSVDKQYVVGSIRHRLMQSGATVVADAASADVVLEARSGALGTDSAETFYGLPEVVIPGMVTIPELKLATRTNQTGTAKLGFVAYDAKAGNVLGSGGVSIAVADHNDWNVLGIGPFKSGSLKSELESAAERDVYNPASGLPNSVVFDGPSRDFGSVRLTGGEE